MTKKKKKKKTKAKYVAEQYTHHDNIFFYKSTQYN